MTRRMTRAIVLIACIALGGCSAMMLGGGQSSGRPIGTDTRSSSDQAADRRITAIVRNRISYDDELGDEDIRIDTVAGVVSLKGSVSSYPQRDRAGRLARDVPDVRRVDNQLVIRR